MLFTKKTPQNHAVNLKLWNEGFHSRPLPNLLDIFKWTNIFHDRAPIMKLLSHTGVVYRIHLLQYHRSVPVLNACQNPEVCSIQKKKKSLQPATTNVSNI